jgi:hypothetical protein
MRLDHVLVSPDIGVRSVTEGHGQGSDHRPIIAELVFRALRRPAASSGLRLVVLHAQDVFRPDLRLEADGQPFYPPGG